MFAKSMQILKILDNFTKFVSIDTTDRYMAKVFCFIIVPELVSPPSPLLYSLPILSSLLLLSSFLAITILAK
jgi:hypothetical protein